VTDALRWAIDVAAVTLSMGWAVVLSLSTRAALVQRWQGKGASK
jgi:hypothetical protein